MSDDVTRALMEVWWSLHELPGSSELRATCKAWQQFYDMFATRLSFRDPVGFGGDRDAVPSAERVAGMFRSFSAVRRLSVDMSDLASAVFVERCCAALGVVRGGALSNLTSLQLRGSAAVAMVAGGGAELSALTRLTELTLDGCGAIKKIDPLKLSLVLCGLRQLRVLCLDHVGTPRLFGKRCVGVVPVAEFLALPGSLPHLERLSLLCGDGLGDDEMSALVTAFGALDKLRTLKLGQLLPAAGGRKDARLLLPSLGSLRGLTALDLGFVDGGSRVHGPQLVAGLAAGLSHLTALTELRLQVRRRFVNADVEDDVEDEDDGGVGDELRRGGIDSQTITPQLGATLARLTQLRTMAADVMMIPGRGSAQDDDPHDREDTSIGRLVASAPGLQDLSLGILPQLPRLALVAFLCSPNLSGLERLRIHGNFYLEVHGISLLAGIASMPKLTELTLEDLMLVELALAHAELSRLRRLELHNVRGLTATQLAATLAAGRTEQPRLAHLDIYKLDLGDYAYNYNSNYNDYHNHNHQLALAHMVAALPLASLRWLRLSDCGLCAGPAATELTNLTRVTHMDLSDNPLPHSLCASLEAQAQARSVTQRNSVAEQARM